MNFKKLLMLGLLLAPLAACGDDGASQTPAPPDAEPDPMPDPEPQPDPEPTPTPDPMPDPMPEIMDRPSGTFEERSADVLGCLETALDDTLATGAIVGVMEDGEVVWRGAYGTKGAGIEEAVGEETLFRFGSILKMMTATAALSLSDEDKLDFDADISDVIPELVFDNLPEGGLTPHLLLSHQGGMIDELTFNGPTDDAALSGFLTSAEFLDIPFHVPPGTFYNYSNPNFMLSGLLIEALGDGNYREEMDARVFAPLGMDRTVFVAEDVLADGDYARGTSVDVFQNINAVEPGTYENTWARPAGLGWTSIDDLLRFGRFLMMGDESVLSDASWQMLRSGQVSTLSLGALESYGYGVIVQGGIFTGSVFRRTPLLLHDGSTGDFTSLLITMPEMGVAVAVMANGPLGPVAGCVTPALLREAERHPPALTPEGLGPDASTFADYVGDYVEGADNLGPFTIELSENGGLLMTIPSLDAQNFEYTKALVPTTRDNFVLETVNGGLPWTGVRGEDGQIVHLRSRISVGYKQDGQDKRLRAVDPVRVQRAIEAIGAARPLDALRDVLRP